MPIVHDDLLQTSTNLLSWKLGSSHFQFHSIKIEILVAVVFQNEQLKDLHIRLRLTILIG